MKTLSTILVVHLLLVIFQPVLRSEERSSESSLYFPPDQGVWETVQPEQVGWDRALLQKALDYAGRNQSSGVVILYRGRILAERYFEVSGAKSGRYQRRVLGRDAAGGAIEDVASVQKSIASILVGIARQKGLLNIDDRVSQYLDAGWSRATPQQEDAITIRHLITMTSGLTDRGLFETRPGTKWRYNTTAYARSMDVVAAASGLDRHELTKKWLTQPLGMTDSRWVKRGSPELQRINGFGFATSARELARFGLMMLAKGKWGDKTVLADQQYLEEATTSSQKLNPAYGYLWWLNRSAKAARGSVRVETAPRDMFFASGALNRRCFIVPSLQLVVTRLGDAPDSPRGFDRQFWKLLAQALPDPDSRSSGSRGKSLVPFTARADETSGKPHSAELDYRFDGQISRPVLENYLARSATVASLLHLALDDDLRMMKNTGVKFAGRAIWMWGSESRINALVEKGEPFVKRIHEMDRDMILQGAIFEIITTDVNNIPIPASVFEEFDIEPEVRKFRYEDMIYPFGHRVDHWRKGASVPDMSRLETRMWFFYVGKRWIDMGLEAIHFGQVEIMDDRDKDHTHWRDMVARLRGYAKTHARRHIVLADAHVPGGGIVHDGELMFDLHSFPSRPRSVKGKPYQE